MKKYRFLIGIIVALLFAAGCATQLSRVEKDFGVSHQLQIYNQTVNPEAEKNLAPVAGLSGQAAQNVQEKYQRGFEKTAPTATSYQFNIGK
ncbi:MAG: hypothetical protein Q8K46_02835 [Deltaproteobacteria bacterium]|nr:hypothetical protein [Deltaproteobacteria bacterium]